MRRPKKPQQPTKDDLDRVRQDIERARAVVEATKSVNETVRSIADKLTEIHDDAFRQAWLAGVAHGLRMAWEMRNGPCIDVAECVRQAWLETHPDIG